MFDWPKMGWWLASREENKVDWRVFEALYAILDKVVLFVKIYAKNQVLKHILAFFFIKICVLEFLTFSILQSSNPKPENPP